MNELVKTGLAVNDDTNLSIVSGVSGNAIKEGTSPRLLCGETSKDGDLKGRTQRGLLTD